MRTQVYNRFLYILGFRGLYPYEIALRIQPYNRLYCLAYAAHNMGWLRCVGVATISRLLKLEVSFAKEPYKKVYILQKRLIISRSLLIVATP